MDGAGTSIHDYSSGIDLATLQPLLTRAEVRAEANLDAIAALGSQAERPRERLQEARSYVGADRLVNASIAMGLILKTLDLLVIMAETGEMLTDPPGISRITLCD
jgi:hypothetical protein